MLHEHEITDMQRAYYSGSIITVDTYMVCLSTKAILTCYKEDKIRENLDFADHTHHALDGFRLNTDYDWILEYI